jgi:hypothetical protein
LLKPAPNEAAVSGLIEELIASGALTISEQGKVSYRG